MSMVYHFSHVAAGREEKVAVGSGAFITVADLERHIKATKLRSLVAKGGRRLYESTLLFYDADAGEEYAADGDQIPANTRVEVRRLTMWSSTYQGSKRAAEFRRLAEESKRRLAERFAGKKTPRGYVCRRCGVPGHFVQACPTNTDGRGSWIPLSSCSSHTTAKAAVANGENDGSSSSYGKKKVISSSGTRPFPVELLCPLCKQVMKDAVLTRCCFRSFCDNCIRARVVSMSACACGARTASADGLVPNKTLREMIVRTLASMSDSKSSSGRCASTVTQEVTDTSGRHHQQPHRHPCLGTNKRPADGTPQAGLLPKMLKTRCC